MKFLALKLTKPMPNIQFRKINQFQDIIHQQAMGISLSSEWKGQISTSEMRALRNQISNYLEEIEHTVQKKGGTPADLINSHFSIYQWMRFLAEKHFLVSHVNALGEFIQLLEKETHKKPLRFLSVATKLIINNSNYLFRSKKLKNTFLVEINEGFISAPESVKTAIIQAVLGNKRKENSTYIRLFSKSEAFQSISRKIKRVEKVNEISFIGNFYNLKDFYTKINQQYFKSELQRPRLIWSARRSHRRLGAYDPESQTITINKILDAKDAPAIALKYILFHEMLHQKLGIRETNGRRYSHTPYFKRQEKSFIGKQEADQEIKRILREKY